MSSKSVDATMATMVAEPYVNHVPTMTGGVGHDQLKRFYKYHFIGGNPPDTELAPISRTVGADQLVDEMLFNNSPIRARSTGCCRVSNLRPKGRDSPRRNRAICGRQGRPRAHLLGPSVSPGAGWATRSCGSAGGETARKAVDQTLPSNELMTRWAASSPI